MLALSRKKNEALVIDNKIEVTILEIKGDQVKIGIKAPKNVSIFRKEIYVQIEEENKKAAEQTVDRETIEKTLDTLLKK